jgi:hypothetical protein
LNSERTVRVPITFIVDLPTPAVRHFWLRLIALGVTVDLDRVRALRDEPSFDVLIEQSMRPPGRVSVIRGEGYREGGELSSILLELTQPVTAALFDQATPKQRQIWLGYEAFEEHTPSPARLERLRAERPRNRRPHG